MAKRAALFGSSEPSVKRGAHWATDAEIASGIQYKVEGDTAYVLRVGVRTLGPDDYETAMKWYLAQGREARKILGGM